MSRENYFININGALVEVTEEQYLCYYRSKRRMRYFEQDIKIESTIRDKDGNITGYAPSKEDSLERLCDTGVDFADTQESVEDMAVRVIMSDKLHKAIDKLPKGERELIDALFFSNDGNGISEREYSEKSGVPRKTLAYRREKILGKLKKLMNS